MSSVGPLHHKIWLPESRPKPRPPSVSFWFVPQEKGLMWQPPGAEQIWENWISLWKWVLKNQNALKSISVYAEGSGTYDGTQFPSFFRSWQLVFWRPSIWFTQNGVNIYRQRPFSLCLSLNRVIKSGAPACWEPMLGNIWWMVNSCYKTIYKKGPSAGRGTAFYNAI